MEELAMPRPSGRRNFTPLAHEERIVIDVDVDNPFRAAKQDAIARFEKNYLAALMTWARGNVSRAARKAGLDRMYLHRLLLRHGFKARAASASTTAAEKSALM